MFLNRLNSSCVKMGQVVELDRDRAEKERAKCDTSTNLRYVELKTLENTFFQGSRMVDDGTLDFNWIQICK